MTITTWNSFATTGCSSVVIVICICMVHFNIWYRLRAHYSISLLWYAVAMHVQFYFRSAANFSRAFWPPSAGPRRRVKSLTTFFYFVATNTKESFLFTFLIDFNFLLYVYNMWVVPLFLKMGVSVENELEAIHPRRHVNRKRSDGCKSMGKCRSRKADIQRFSVSGRG